MTTAWTDPEAGQKHENMLKKYWIFVSDDECNDPDHKDNYYIKCQF